MSDTVYIVSGFMRSGTSMMMKALEAGGLDARYSETRDDWMNERWADDNYRPNRGGFYELDREEYQKEDFPKPYAGKLIKCLFGGMLRLRGDLGLNYKIVYMLRDPEEIRQSHEAFFGRPPRRDMELYTDTMNRVIGILKQRKDVDLSVLQYRDVVESPLETFENLEMLKGWPIWADKAADIVDQKQLRFKLEELDVGI